MDEYSIGEYIIYRNGEKYELGRIKNLREDGAFVAYHEGETGALTSYSHMHKLINWYCIKDTTLGGDYFKADTPQMDCDTCRYGQDKHRYAHICNECGAGINNYTPQTETQTETQNSNLTFKKRTMRDCYNCKRYETEGECIECHYEPKDEPQTCSVNGRPYTDCCNCEYFKCTADEPQYRSE